MYLANLNIYQGTHELIGIYQKRSQYKGHVKTKKLNSKNDEKKIRKQIKNKVIQKQNGDIYKKKVSVIAIYRDINVLVCPPPPPSPPPSSAVGMRHLVSGADPGGGTFGGMTVTVNIGNMLYTTKVMNYIRPKPISNNSFCVWTIIHVTAP